MCRAHQEIARARAALCETGARFVLLSGSGSALFAVYREEAQASAALARLQGPADRLHLLTRTATAVPEPVPSLAGSALASGEAGVLRG
jgi:4-diphosphocytidyl-2C-methyl-D-erythritol kinase